MHRAKSKQWGGRGAVGRRYLQPTAASLLSAFIKPAYEYLISAQTKIALNKWRWWEIAR